MLRKYYNEPTTRRLALFSVICSTSYPYSPFSITRCMHYSLNQEVRLAQGVQAGEKRLREVATSDRFTHFSSTTETLFI